MRTSNKHGTVGEWTYNAIYPWVPVEIPNWFRSDGIPQQLVNLRAVPEVLEDLLCNGAGQPLLVIRVLYERDPSGDSKCPKDNQRRPSALPNGKMQHHHRNRQLTPCTTDGSGIEGGGRFTSTAGRSRFGTGLA